MSSNKQAVTILAILALLPAVTGCYTVDEYGLDEPAQQATPTTTTTSTLAAATTTTTTRPTHLPLRSPADLRAEYLADSRMNFEARYFPKSDSQQVRLEIYGVITGLEFGYVMLEWDTAAASLAVLPRTELAGYDIGNAVKAICSISFYDPAGVFYFEDCYGLEPITDYETAAEDCTRGERGGKPRQHGPACEHGSYLLPGQTPWLE